MSQIKNKFLSNMAANTIKGNNTGGSSNPLDLSTAQVTAMLSIFTTSLQGVVPASGGGTTNFLRADGTWAAPGGASPLTTKGDLYGFSTVNARLPVGTNGQHLSVDSTQTLGIKWITSGRTINGQTGTTYTFVLADGSATDGNPLVSATNASAQTYTVPTNASVAFPVGTQIDVTQLGAGLVTFAAAGGVTLNSLSGGLSMLGQYSAATLIKTATDVWDVYGTGINSVNMSLSDWTAYTPIYVALGTVTNSSIFYRRVGDSIEIQGTFTTGTTTGSTASISIPSGLTIDSTKISSSVYTAVGVGGNAASASFAEPILARGGDTTLGMGLWNAAAAPLTPNNGSNLSASSTQMSISAKIPISGYTSTSQGTLTAPRSSVYLDTYSGYGGTNTKVPFFTNSSVTGSAMTVTTNDSTSGARITINETGIYAVSFSIDGATSGSAVAAIAKNATGVYTTSASALTTTVRRALSMSGAIVSVDSVASTSVCEIYAVGDIINPQTDAAVPNTAARAHFSITKVSN